MKTWKMMIKKETSTELGRFSQVSGPMLVPLQLFD